MGRAVIYAGKLPVEKGTVISLPDTGTATPKLTVNLILNDQITNAKALGIVAEVVNGEVVIGSPKKPLSANHAIKVVAEWNSKAKKEK
jgi:hypothetical protein